MKKILVLCCVASLFCGCSRFLEEYSQDLAKVETFSDLDEVLLGKAICHRADSKIILTEYHP